MLDNLSEENQLKLVSKCGIMLKYISKQSYAVQEAALEDDPSASKYIVVTEEREKIKMEQLAPILEKLSDLIISTLDIKDDEVVAKTNIFTLLAETYPTSYFTRNVPPEEKIENYLSRR